PVVEPFGEEPDHRPAALDRRRRQPPRSHVVAELDDHRRERLRIALIAGDHPRRPAFTTPRHQLTLRTGAVTTTSPYSSPGAALSGPSMASGAGSCPFTCGSMSSGLP